MVLRGGVLRYTSSFLVIVEKTPPWYSDISRPTAYIVCKIKNLIKGEEMTTQLQAIKMDETNTETTNPAWRTLYRVGGMAALGTVLVGLVEIGITFLPGGNTPYKTVFDWFTLF